ncbi:zinc finger protein 449-like [Dasypus novemcinctus]|uniref:zinc finger protein 449-like n=1 Tax=Dasypus novemcinctus TaxID=9361 RepID=UPI00265ECA36|nr:zinc finger protein 449-like [Dasypus novemcinctus]
MAMILGSAIQASLNQGSMLQQYDSDCEVFRQRFRQFQYKEAAGPREAFNKLWELCCQWLQPHIRSKEQMLELLVLEQFLRILPTEIETWARLYRPDKREKILALIEDLERELEIPKKQVPRPEMLLEEQEPMDTAHTRTTTELESPALQVMGCFQDSTLAAEKITQEGPQEQNYAAIGHDQAYLEPEHPGPNPERSFLVDLTEYLWEKDFQNSKGFGVEGENEENTTKQKILEDMYSFIFNLEGNSVHGPTSQEDQKELENQWEVCSEEPQVDFTKVYNYQNHFPGEQPESSYTEEPLNLVSHRENSPGEKSHQCSTCGNWFVEKSQHTEQGRIYSGEEPPKCPESGASFLFSSDLCSDYELDTGETPDEYTTYQK